MDTTMVHISKRAFLTLCLIVFILTSVIAQKPIIKAVVRKVNSTDEIVTIKGSNFGADYTKLAVFFGAAKAVIIPPATDQLLEVRVPSGATYNHVSVTYLPSNLTGYSDEKFLLSFNGAYGVAATNFVGQSNFPAGALLYDLCMCDFNGDKKNDIVGSNNADVVVSVFTNTSSGPGNVNFSKTNLLLGFNSLYVRCGDLNGDGKSDLIVSQGPGSGLGNEIYVYRNTSIGATITFAAPITLKMDGKKVTTVEMGDLDLDGLPEIIFSNQSINKIGILVNQSTTSSIIFSTVPKEIEVTGAGTTDGIAVGDLNGDHYPEIVTSQYQITLSDMFVLENKSIPGTINFSGVTKLTIDRNVKSIRIGDLDGDNKPDIAATRVLGLGGLGMGVFLNQSSPSTLSFGALKELTTTSRCNGLDFGDLDGDGKTDIVATSVAELSITILNNTSTPGNLTFASIFKPVTNITRFVQVGDVDTDGKPDIALTSVDNGSITFSQVSILRNNACVIPKVTPEGPLTICSGSPLKLQATVSNGIMYNWKNVATSVKNSADAFYDVTASGQYQVTAVAEAGACSTLSNIVDVTVSGPNSLLPGTIPTLGPICTNGTLQLTVNDVGVGAQYRWTGPAGYTATGRIPAPITNFSLEKTGRYSLDILTAGGCVAQSLSTTVGIIDIEDFKVTAVGSDVLCQGDPAKLLMVSPTPAGFSYKWHNAAGEISGATLPTYSTSAADEYYVIATSANCDPKTTPRVKITVASYPVPNFNAPLSACKGQDVQFTDQSTADPVLEVFYEWDFGDSKTATEKNPIHNYTAAATRQVTLSISYKNGACKVTSNPTAHPISIQNAIPPVITNPDNTYNVCVGEKLRLEVVGAFNSYAWSTGETTQFIEVTKEGIYKVEVTTNICTLNAQRNISESETNVLASADPAQINEGLTSQLTASGLDNYTWSPAETLSNSTIANPVASPIETTRYTVTGVADNGCPGTATIEVNVIGEAKVNKLIPSNFFSPNKTGPIESETWLVDKILEYPECNVAIYDDKGVKVFEAKPYANDWDGTHKGKRLPDGVYYYVIRCDGEESKPKSGSITLLR